MFDPTTLNFDTNAFAEAVTTYQTAKKAIDTISINTEDNVPAQYTQAYNELFTITTIVWQQQTQTNILPGISRYAQEINQCYTTIPQILSYQVSSSPGEMISSLSDLIKEMISLTQDQRTAIEIALQLAAQSVINLEPYASDPDIKTALPSWYKSYTDIMAHMQSAKTQLQSMADWLDKVYSGWETYMNYVESNPDTQALQELQYPIESYSGNWASMNSLLQAL